MENYIFKYEPLYVARANTPQFDERFIGFGMTRNTQVNIYLTDHPFMYVTIYLSVYQNKSYV